ncbi:LuxR C-terminal-related transcriptional regulator [Saccharopolyspora sp. NPDC002578]
MRAEFRHGETGGGGDARKRAELLDRGRRLLQGVEGLTGRRRGVVHDPAGLESALVVVVGELAEEMSDGQPESRVGTTLAEVHALRFELRDLLARERSRRLDAVESELGPLRDVGEPEQLLGQVCEAVVRGCGLDRVLLSRVEGVTWRPHKSHAIDNREAERTFRDWLRVTPEVPLADMPLEGEMVRRRGPAIVTDPTGDPRVYRPLLDASAMNSYVAAPVMPTGRVIGFLHADRMAEPVTQLDRDVLWFFAVGFGRIFERAVLMARLREQRDQVRSALQAVEEVLDGLASAEIELGGNDAGRRGGGSRSERPPLEPSLTGRELEVLALMATGATNNRIAEELVIATGTVKSHVKRILRKLGAENRAEAISQYLRLTM